MKLFDLTLLLSYCALIFFLSAQETLPVAMLFPHQDKLIHGSAYAVMGLFAWRYFSHIFEIKTLLAFTSILFCSIYGFSDEFHQSYVVGRQADVWDWLADTLGASFAVLLLTQMRKSIPKMGR